MQHQHSLDNATKSRLSQTLRTGLGFVAGLGALALLAHAGLAQEGAAAAAKTDPMP